MSTCSKMAPSPSCLPPALLAPARRFSPPFTPSSNFKLGNIKKIILTRPAVSVDEQHGFLPGTLLEKMAPWVIPITDVFKEHYSVLQLERMLQDEIVEVAPLAYMRGRTLKNAIVIFDEAQNATAVADEDGPYPYRRKLAHDRHWRHGAA
jgi:hypothetical protein